jgi:hypothetical protein
MGALCAKSSGTKPALETGDKKIKQKTPASKQTMKLYYFDIYGRADSIRFLLSHAKVHYENVLISQD